MLTGEIRNQVDRIIGSMNMLLHGVENPDIRYRDSLTQDHAGHVRD